MSVQQEAAEELFGPGIRAQAEEIVARYPAGRQRSALLPLLHLVQSVQGYVTPEGGRFCAQMLGLTEAEVAAVSTFYSMYKRQPTGDYLVSVCTNTLCGLLGGDDILAALRAELDVHDNETTADGTFTLEHAECLAACDYAPVVTVNYEYFDQQTPESAVELVRRIRAGELPMPTRGAPLCKFREIERQVAGFPDERPDALAAGGSGGEPTMAGLRLAREHGAAAEGDGRRTRGPAGGSAEEAHREAGAQAPPTFAAQDQAERTVTSAAESAEPGPAADTGEHAADDTREPKRRRRGKRED